MRNFLIKDIQDNSILDSKFEFNNLEYLHIVMNKHSTWPRIRDLLENGVSYPVNNILEEDRLLRLHYNLDCSNYLIRDSALEGKIEEFVLNELSYGYLLLISKHKVHLIQGTEVCPVHIVK